MRIGATLLLRDGGCVQSYGWEFERPLGGLQHALTMLERYEVDEIAVLRPVRMNDDDAAKQRDRAALGAVVSRTPLCFGGGLRLQADLELISGIPVERVVLNSAYVDRDLALLEDARGRFGRQALVASLPVRRAAVGSLEVFASAAGCFVPLDDAITACVLEYANEVVLHDCVNEGVEDGFDAALLEAWPLPVEQTILSGGIGPAVVRSARDAGCAAVHVDNRLLHREYSVRRLRRG